MQLDNRNILFRKGIFSVLIVAIFFCALMLVYSHARKSYWSVGFNDGSIDAKVKILNSIKDAVGRVPKCESFKGVPLPTEVLRVKSEFLFVIKYEDGKVIFCN